MLMHYGWIGVQIIFLKNPKAFWTLKKELPCLYKSVIRSAIEYGCVIRHHNLTIAQSNRPKALQKRALRIIMHPITLPYSFALAYCEIESLRLRRHNF